MREISFRAKTEQGEWLYGFYHNETSIESNASDRKVTRHHIYTQDFDKFVIHETVGQFTGLKDRNGEKIFDGDILQEYSGEDRGYIRYDEDDGMYYLVVDNVLHDFSTCNSKWYEIIGNIHDNPELLKEKDNE